MEEPIPGRPPSAKDLYECTATIIEALWKTAKHIQVGGRGQHCEDYEWQDIIDRLREKE